MARRDAVRVATAARKHAKESIGRMERHLAKRNVAGAAREAKFLNALQKNGVREASIAAGNRVPVKANAGNRALAAIRAGDRMATSRVLADMSQSIMAPARVPLREKWVWTANANACAACLLEHGREFPPEAFFSPMHRSCHCMPDNPGLARELTNDELAEVLINRGGRDANLGFSLLDGSLSRSGLRVRVPGGFAQSSRAVPNRIMQAPQHKWTSGETKLLKDHLPATAGRQEVIGTFRGTFPDFLGSDQAIWAKHQRIHGLLGKKTTRVPKPAVGTAQEKAAILREIREAGKTIGGLTDDTLKTYLPGANIEGAGTLRLKNGTLVQFQGLSETQINRLILDLAQVDEALLSIEGLGGPGTSYVKHIVFGNNEHATWAMGQDMSKAAGAWSRSRFTLAVRMDVTHRGSVLNTIRHELGHAYQSRFGGRVFKAGLADEDGLQFFLGDAGWAKLPARAKAYYDYPRDVLTGKWTFSGTGGGAGQAMREFWAETVAMFYEEPALVKQISRALFDSDEFYDRVKLALGA